MVANTHADMQCTSEVIVYNHVYSLNYTSKEFSGLLPFTVIVCWSTNKCV